MNTQEQISSDLNSISSYTDGAKIHQCPDHVIRQNFRMWLDGSYHGEGTYHANVETLQQIKDSPKKMRSFIINQFTDFVASDWGCSYGHAQKSIVKALSEDELKALTVELADDAFSLIRADDLEVL